MEKEQQPSQDKAASQEAVVTSDPKDRQPALEPEADERARSERSGEGDRTDTKEMSSLDE